jgi:hypothetical protein
MKVTIDRKQLKNCLDQGIKIISRIKRGSHPLYNHVQLDFKDNRLKLSCYDGSYGILADYGEIQCQPARYLIDAQTCYHLISFSDQESLEFDFQTTKLVVIDNNNPYEFTYYEAEGGDLSNIFKQYSTLENPIVVTKSEEFAKISQFLEPCVAQDVARSFLSGVYFDGNFVATDGNMCAVHIHITHQENSIFIPKEGLTFIATLPNTSPIYIYSVKNIIVCTCEMFELVLPQVGGNFPNYQAIINSCATYPFSFSIQKSVIEKICQKLTPFADENQRMIADLLFSTDNSLTISATSQGTKSGKETLRSLLSICPEEALLFLVNIKIFSNLVSSIPCETLIIKYSSNNKLPIVITDGGKNTHYSSVLSIR